MFEYEGQQYTLEDLQLEATQRGVSFDHYLKEMKENYGLIPISIYELAKFRIPMCNFIYQITVL